MAIRVLEERPVVGGEKFSAVIGPSRAFRRLTATALALSLGAAAWAALRASEGAPAQGESTLALALFAVSLGSAWVSGGSEEIVCQSGLLRHRRAGALGERGRIVPVDGVRSVEGPAVTAAVAFGGIRLDTSRGPLVVGRRLDGEDAGWLARAIRDHLTVATRSTVGAGAPRPQRAGLPGVLERIRARR